ncbi:hypothetical protein PF011_g13846 [Phytophthora fragariae]|uniref:Uncharacterized protein n=1 Tax=Phytophthora fragariae TaxID=53985 RepID=A0A6A3K903_9STRA|nr:hypothetical protein PF011_g13846 [Phytophthora fragariae]
MTTECSTRCLHGATAFGDDDQLHFLSTRHLREVKLRQLVGERMYYLPLRSDLYTRPSSMLLDACQTYSKRAPYLQQICPT